MLKIEFFQLVNAVQYSLKNGAYNALKIIEKKIEDVRLVVNGAGASAIACTKLFLSLGIKKENLGLGAKSK